MGSKTPRKTILPIYRIKTIMKTTPDVGQVSADAYFLMAKATEFFVTFLAEESFKNTSGNHLEYKNIADVVQFVDSFDFLRDLIPKKITVREYREIMEEKSRTINQDDLSFYLNISNEKKVNTKSN